MKSNTHLVNMLISSGVIKSKEIAEAFNSIDRKGFVLKEYSQHAYENRPLPIKGNQTISQPSTLAFMLEKLQPLPNEHVLDVGSGSGYSTALLARLVLPKGDVVGVEILPELYDFGMTNLLKTGLKNYKLVKAKDKLGYEEEAPYDKILVSAFATKIPDQLVNQLKVGGVMVIPINNSLVKVEKVSDNNIITTEYAGFVFVPLITL